MYKPKIFSYLLISFLFLNCDGVKKVSSENTVTNTVFVQKAIIGEAPEENLATTINTAQINGNVVTLSVSYSGGCEEHVFDLVGATVVMKSFPPQREVVLVRNSKGDTCREWITTEIEFDISELAFNAKHGDEIILHLKGFGELTYIYPRD